MKVAKVGIGGAVQAKQNELAQIDIEQIEADVAWVALMTDVDLPSYDENGEEAGEDE